MALIVQKFGGSSVADSQCIRNICRIIAETYDAGNQVVVVLSAQGDTTDLLLEKARELNPTPSNRELDMLLSTGEQVSIALAAMCMERMGYPAVSFTGWQAGIQTSSEHACARIHQISGGAIRRELAKGRIVFVAGFQGIDPLGEITTLGRGGSDTTAVALAAALHADACQFFKDVDGVYTADPGKDPTAVKLDEITYDDMLEMVNAGAQVLHDRSVLLAMRHNIPLEVRSSFTGNPGTLVHSMVSQEKVS